MAFPTSPTNGQTYKNYTYKSASASWKQTQAIYDSGSNANGSWIRFADGTMTCSFRNNRTQTITLTTPANSSAVAYATWVWTFPQAFISAPTGLTATGDFGWGPGLEYHQAFSATTTQATIEEGILVSVNPASLSCDTYVTATGKWK